ncbi:hypothetical protein WMY93_017643 [Mugilogobius chulae]|uniref:NUCB1-like N-terminal domain-containing protein n=1 Tax=Mugilogobius chulae TaxID=88201 RepID=A0AAW0P0C5_9GOBI
MNELTTASAAHTNILCRGLQPSSDSEDSNTLDCSFLSMELRALLFPLVLLQILVQTQSSPVNRNHTQTQDKPPPKSADVGLHYNKYLQQVIEYLEKDPHFREKLKNANMSHIQDGSLAQELDFVHHDVRTKLDELKREEVIRLRMLLKAKKDLKNGKGEFKNHQALLKHFDHMDFKNPHVFEAQDLDRLIKAATKDLKSLDQQHHQAFKQYEMLKEHQRRERLKHMSKEEREKKSATTRRMKEKHSKHGKINHPGSEEQLKEVWRDTDGLDPEDFNSKTFFKLHDGYLDEDEQEALFNKELAKAYESDHEEDDMMEMEEERLRMREELQSEYDTDHDQLISEQEFEAHAKSKEFHDNEEWETLDHAPFYTDEEMEEFESHLDQEMDQHYNEVEKLEQQKHELEQKQKELDQRKHELDKLDSTRLECPAELFPCSGGENTLSKSQSKLSIVSPQLSSDEKSKSVRRAEDPGEAVESDDVISVPSSDDSSFSLRQPDGV